ncbi:HNH endonuclease [Gordonia sp. CPCC 206044]|uniref:HNH endonuclease signature motif containing protein n=1 Tax=Gordonia sp. CPCC 206044 TaxID=3140793 RepID=UPI003AF3C391
MLCYSDSVADDAVLASSAMTESDLGDAGLQAQRLERQAAARKILAAYRVGRASFERIIAQESAINPRIGNAADKAAVGEVSLRFGVSKSMAGRWIELATLLQDLPRLRLRFLAGEYSVNRVTLMARAVLRFDERQRDDALDQVVELADQAVNDNVLRENLDEMVIEAQPDVAVDERAEFTDLHQNVTITAEAHGHSTIDACVPAEYGVHLAKRIIALIEARLCSRDPRTVGQQRVVAFGELTETPGVRLRCECGDHDCPRHTPRPDPSGAVTPPPSEIIVVVDPQVRVPYLSGYGPIDRVHAETIAGVATRIRRVDDGMSADPIVTDAPGGSSGPAPPLDRSGHGGLQRPPPGALTYAPSAALRRHLERTYRHCVYPYCNRPFHECEIDHLVPFDHADPLGGGWTVRGNAAPMCRPDHQRKHLGTWVPTMNTDRSITWRDSRSGRVIVVRPAR